MSASGWPRDLIICRCEEVTVGEVEDLVARGITDPNQIKRLCRMGMGLCQGRTCGSVLEALVARLSGQGAAAVGYLAARAPVRPVPACDIAAASDADLPDFADPH